MQTVSILIHHQFVILYISQNSGNGKGSNEKQNAIHLLILVLLNLGHVLPLQMYSADPDQLASEEANWSGSALFAVKYVN